MTKYQVYSKLIVILHGHLIYISLFNFLIEKTIDGGLEDLCDVDVELANEKNLCPRLDRQHRVSLQIYGTVARFGICYAVSKCKLLSQN